jgi:hypothetical protein
MRLKTCSKRAEAVSSFSCKNWREDSTYKSYHSVEDNIKMETKVIENGRVDMSHLSEGINQWRALVEPVTDMWFLLKAANQPINNC